MISQLGPGTPGSPSTRRTTPPIGTMAYRAVPQRHAGPVLKRCVRNCGPRPGGRNPTHRKVGHDRQRPSCDGSTSGAGCGSTIGSLEAVSSPGRGATATAPAHRPGLGLAGPDAPDRRRVQLARGPPGESQMSLFLGDAPARLPGNGRRAIRAVHIPRRTDLDVGGPRRRSNKVPGGADRARRLSKAVFKVSTSSDAVRRFGTRRSDVLLHVCAHAQCTTAQLVDMLRQLVVEAPP